ncbi:glycerophosphoryl diester phosphodiesterase family protein [Caenibius tardaugens NBRC 16725]|uniref:Glycerophosphoryl diester phosphodiesterase family protein n=1 Tax=Caenibius tardaugens NBRC 16725 TaxID=1219035 RepID=U2ZUQ6_9SPHN|nr:glycerophosphodiester phosphodiesterase family protein [Caenibius tardaugens]AZI36480.1 glycerophosphodiester phosphodiesterase [Caenibius tardaugens NBRC 16725]GAD49114.1 glycerophosphoryl diester phosphodiesterase family protein [Caenibius tardaugens NBRC 16725]
MLFAAIDQWRAPAPPAGKVAWLKGQVYAHRGLHGHGVAENSPAAFAGAIARGLGIECDVQRSGDGQAVVFHDWELDRLTGDTGAVGDLSAAQLGKIVLTGGDDTIPTLGATLAQVRGQVPILIEVKSRRDRRIHALCLAVRRVLEGYRGHHAVMSFDPRVSRWFARHSPQTVRGLVVTEEGARTLSGSARRHLALWHARPDFLAYDIRDLPSAFPEAQRQRGLPVLTWTVRSAELAERAAVYADAAIAEGGGIG